MYNFLRKHFPTIATIIITAVICFSLSSAFYSGELFVIPGEDAKFYTIEKVLKNRFYTDFDESKATDSAIDGYVKSLGDPYTEYMNEKDLEQFYSYINSSYCGIGVTVQNNAEDDTILIIGVFEGSPAQKAGLAEGDVLTKVNGVAFKGSQLTEATDKILGQEGTTVKIEVLKKSTGKLTEFDLTRENIKTKSVSAEVLDGDIGYIAISQFAEDTADLFKTHLKDFEKQDIKGLIVDVRNNGGGITTAIEGVADSLLPKGDVIYYTSNKSGYKKYTYSKEEGSDIPLVVLANNNSASASEILVGTIKDNNRGKIVGTKTFGKGLVQELVPLTDGTAIKITVEKYYTPNGDYIDKKGIEPDYVVEQTADATEDLQLKKAIELLK